MASTWRAIDSRARSVAPGCSFSSAQSSNSTPRGT